jgi:hypothetical protein
MRIFKQIIIGLIFISLLGGLVFLGYYLLKPSPSCDDKVRNQGEEGVDCGGPCPSCELAETKEIEVLLIEAVPGGPGFYDVVAQIKNPNQNYGSGKLPYQFNLFDEQNNLIGKFAGTSFILPNQTKYLIQLKLETTALLNKVKLSFGNIEWQKLDGLQPPQLAIQQKEYFVLNEEAIYSRAKAVLANKTNFDFNKIDIDVLLLDASRKIIGLNTTEIRSLLAGQERDFAAVWFSPVAGEAAFMEIEAETNVFDPENYLKKSGDSERFQEY